jgi:outer membrane immunogenic protein
MHRFLSTSLIALTVGILPFSASASDLNGRTSDPTSAEYVAPISWTGLWIAGEGGALFANDKLSAEFFDDHGPDHGASVGGSIDGLGSSGIFGEASIGFDKQIGRALVGVFAGVNIDNTEFVAEVHSSHLEDSGNAELTFSKKWGGVAGARLGFLVTPKTLVYGEGGYAFGEMEKLEFSASATGMDPISGEVFPKQDTDLSGYFVGLGVESAIGSGLYVRASGRYVKYDDLNLLSVSDEGDTLRIDQEREELIAKAGLVYKIGTDLPSGLGF